MFANIILFLTIHSLARIEAQNAEMKANLPADYPFFAAIHRSRTPGNYSFDDVVCSAGILTSTKVVTTCSCLRILEIGMDIREEGPFYPFQYYVSMGIGEIGVSYANTSNVTTMRVKKIDDHGSCYHNNKTGLWYGDVALFTLENQINFTSRIQPMPLPELKMFESSAVFEELANNRSLTCVALAWSKSSPELVALDVELLAMRDCVDHCESYIEPLFCLIRNRISGFMIKMAKPFNESTAYTGGPLVCNGTVWALVNLRWRCSQELYYQITSPAEVIFALVNFNISFVENPVIKAFKRVLIGRQDGLSNPN